MTCTRPYCTRPAEPGRQMCGVHAALYRDYQRRTRAARKAMGMCLWAGCGPALPEQSLCLKHKVYHWAARAASRAKKAEL